MTADIRKIKTRDLDLDGAFRRARNGAIVLTVLVVSYVLQLGVAAIPVLSTYPDLIELAQSDEDALAVLVGIGMLAGLAIAATALSVFGWVSRSRVAMWLGFALFAVNWFFYIIVWMTGEFEVSGLLLNILGPIFLWKGIAGANQYHRLKNRSARASDVAVF